MGTRLGTSCLVTSAVLVVTSVLLVVTSLGTGRLLGYTRASPVWVLVVTSFC